MVVASRVAVDMEALVVQETVMVLGTVTETGIVMEKKRLKRIPIESHVKGMSTTIKGTHGRRVLHARAGLAFHYLLLENHI